MGKSEKLVTAKDGECVNGQWGTSSSVTSYTKPKPQYANDGLVVTEFMGSTCGGPNQVNPTELNFYGNYACTNNTLSGSVFMQSMMVYSDNNYIYEYAEPNCMGMSSYISLANVPNCLNYGSRSALVKVNRYVPPTPAPVNYPTPAPYDPSSGYYYFPPADVSLGGYSYYSMSVPSNAQIIELDTRT